VNRRLHNAAVFCALVWLVALLTAIMTGGHLAERLVLSACPFGLAAGTLCLARAWLLKRGERHG
jgi:hypothetical protein